MRILHTSDWHLGKTLQRRTRTTEFERFLDWLVEIIRSEQVDVLLLAGDVFDTTTPSTRALTLYFSFLAKAREAGLLHVVVVGGNHDSPALLEASEALLRTAQIHVVGGITTDLSRQVLLLAGKDHQPGLIVGAVPYLRERDVRTVEGAETPEDKVRKLEEGIRQHYKEIAEVARQMRDSANLTVPMVFTGHLFAAGGRVLKDDGMRDLYVGSLAYVPADVFPEDAAYVALGHLHSPQIVGGRPHIRYSGSPIPMGFGEFGQEKSVVLVDLTTTPCEPRLIPVPSFQMLRTVRGDLNAIQDELVRLSRLSEDVWIDVLFESEALVPDLRDRLEKIVEGSTLSLLRIRNERILTHAMEHQAPKVDLEELTEEEVFDLCLLRHNIAEPDALELRSTFQELLQIRIHSAEPESEGNSP